MPEKLETVDLSRFPSWVVDPAIKGYVAAVGYARVQKKNPNALRRVALLNAKAELAKQIEIFVDSELFRTSVCTAQECRSDMKSYSNQYTSRLMQNVEITGEWLDPQTGDLYIRVAAKQGE